MLLLWLVMFGRESSPDLAPWVIVALTLWVVVDHLVSAWVVPTGFRVYGPARGSLAIAPEQTG